jgi:predicted nucleic acid-binding protein
MDYKNMSAILDTNIWTSFFLVSDSNHEKATEIIKNESKNQLQIMPDLVFYEAITVLRNKSGIEKSTLFMDLVKNTVDINVRLFYENNRDIAKLAYDVNFSKLSYVDLLLLYLSKEYTIITFDKELITAITIYGGHYKI